MLRTGFLLTFHLLHYSLFDATNRIKIIRLEG